jgi:hypothetical protein
MHIPSATFLCFSPMWQNMAIKIGTNMANLEQKRAVTKKNRERKKADFLLSSKYTR